MRFWTGIVVMALVLVMGGTVGGAHAADRDATAPEPSAKTQSITKPFTTVDLVAPALPIGLTAEEGVESIAAEGAEPEEAVPTTTQKEKATGTPGHAEGVINAADLGGEQKYLQLNLGSGNIVTFTLDAAAKVNGAEGGVVRCSLANRCAWIT